MAHILDNVLPLSGLNLTRTRAEFSRKVEYVFGTPPPRHLATDFETLTDVLIENI